jgi:hypothetical protein
MKYPLAPPDRDELDSSFNPHFHPSSLINQSALSHRGAVRMTAWQTRLLLFLIVIVILIVFAHRGNNYDYDYD